MAKYRNRALRRNPYPELDLFSWAAERNRRHRAPYHVRQIAMRYGLTETMAAVICASAGIGRGAE